MVPWVLGGGGWSAASHSEYYREVGVSDFLLERLKWLMGQDGVLLPTCLFSLHLQTQLFIPFHHFISLEVFFDLQKPPLSFVAAEQVFGIV